MSIEHKQQRSSRQLLKKLSKEMTECSRPSPTRQQGQNYPLEISLQAETEETPKPGRNGSAPIDFEMDERKTVFMIGLPTTTDQPFFITWIKNVLPDLKFKKIRFPKKKQKSAFAFIEFEDVDSREKILSLTHLNFRNRELKFQPYRTGEELQRFREGVQKRRLYVFGLKPSIRKMDLRIIFSRFGELDDAYLIKNRKTGRSKCFGYVIFKEAEVAENTASVGSYEYQGITVRFKLHETRNGRKNNTVNSKGKKRGIIESKRNKVKKHRMEEKDERDFDQSNSRLKNMEEYEYRKRVEFQNRRFYKRNLSLKENQQSYREFIEFHSMRPCNGSYFDRRGYMKHFEQNLRCNRGEVAETRYRRYRNSNF